MLTILFFNLFLASGWTGYGRRGSHNNPQLTFFWGRQGILLLSLSGTWVMYICNVHFQKTTRLSEPLCSIEISYTLYIIYFRYQQHTKYLILVLKTKGSAGHFFFTFSWLTDGLARGGAVVWLRKCSHFWKYVWRTAMRMLHTYD